MNSRQLRQIGTIRADVRHAQPHSPALAVPDASGDAIHTTYCTGHVVAGGPVRTCESPAVRSESTTRGTTPNKDSRARDAPSSTGRRPARSIEVATCSMVTVDASATDAAGRPHIPRTTWLSEPPVATSTNTTLASAPIAQHRTD